MRAKIGNGYFHIQGPVEVIILKVMVLRRKGCLSVESVEKYIGVIVLTVLMHIFLCGMMDYKIRDCPFVVRNEGDNHRWAQPYPFSGSRGCQKHNRFYAL